MTLMRTSAAAALGSPRTVAVRDFAKESQNLVKPKGWLEFAKADFFAPFWQNNDRRRPAFGEEKAQAAG